MAETFTVKLSRFQSQPWGFRLQGGKDFSTPLSIQRIQAESLADKVGLQSGDAILKINEVNTDSLRHKEAQDAIVRAGNSFELTVQRGGMKIWRPSVTPIEKLRTGAKQNFPMVDPAPIVRTSLAADKQEFRQIGSSHNIKPKPFGTIEMNGDRVAAVVHNQYNSPAPLYSAQNLAETLSSQAEVLAGGVKGYNFMKKDTPVNKDSAVYKMVLEEESAPPSSSADKYEHDEPTFKGMTNPNVQSRSFVDLQRSLDDGEESPTPVARPPGMRSVEAPHTLPQSMLDGAPKGSDNVCSECSRLIIGVFVRIKDKNLHADCFKCNTCGANLKNVGYYNINDKLYCDVHARQVARQAPPAPNLTPITIAPGGNLPTNVGFIPSYNRPRTPTAPGTGSYGPVPFQPHMEDLEPQPPMPASMVECGGGTGMSIPTTPDSPKHLSWLPPRTLTPELQAKLILQSETFASVDDVMQISSTTVSSATNIPKEAGTHHPITAPSANVHKPQTGTGSNFINQAAGTKFTWPPKQSDSEDAAAVEKAPSPSAPTPCYRAPPSTQHTQYTPAVFKQSPTATPTFGAPHSPVPKSVSPTFPSPFSPSTANPPTYKSVAPSGPMTPTTPITPSWAPPPLPSSMIGSSSVAPPKPPSSTAGTGTAGLTRPAPKRGRGVLKTSVGPGTRIPICALCGSPIRGPFVTAMGKTWCPDHFLCVNNTCRRPLQDIGFVEEQGQLYCENCYESYLAPICNKCTARIKGDCLNAIGKQWHPECFLCSYCHTAFGNSHFYLEDGLPYCEKDWNELFTTKCVSCGFAIEAGDRWVEALNSNFHSQCFKCTICHKNLEGQSFFAKGGRPFCKSHAR